MQKRAALQIRLLQSEISGDHILHALALASAVSGGEQQTGDKPAPFKPEYEGVQTRLLDGDLVSFQVKMKGARDNSDVDALRRMCRCAVRVNQRLWFCASFTHKHGRRGWHMGRGCCLHHLASAPARAENDRCRSHGFGLRREQDTDGVRT